MVKLTADMVLTQSKCKDLANVRKLNFWASEIDDIRILRDLRNIEVISVSVNEITSLEDFQYCSHLQELYIRKNNISNLNEICYLKKLPKLRTLWLADNPCTTGALYRMTVLKNLPRLTKLDNIVVEEEELNDAIDQGLELVCPKPMKSGSESIPRNSSDVSVSSIGFTLNEASKQDDGLGAKLSENGCSSSSSNTTSDTGVSASKTTASEERNANILNAVLALVNELDHLGLQTVISSCQRRLQT